MYGVMDRFDDIPKAAWIALVVLAFIVFWPVGLGLLIYLKWSGRMSYWRGGCGRWYSPEASGAARDEWRDTTLTTVRNAPKDLPPSTSGAMRRSERCSKLPAIGPVRVAGSFLHLRRRP